MSNVVLGWIQSFLTNRTQQVSFDGQLSSKQSPLLGVPQGGSVLGPLAAVHFVHCWAWTVDLASWSAYPPVWRRRPSLYQRSMPVSDVRVAVYSFAVCVHGINEWMRVSWLRLNPTKTQVMWLGSGQQLKYVDINDIPVLSTTVSVVESARDLEVILDSRLTLSANVAALCRARVLPTQATTLGRPIDDGGSCKNRCCGVYILSVRLL